MILKNSRAGEDPIPCEKGQGVLPGCGPLAVPYVAQQSQTAERYPQMRALETGTLFPELNLPFHLKVNATVLPDTPRNQLTALEFVLLELGLYLDTHPYDSEALSLFRNYLDLERTARAAYVAQYGPLTHRDAETGGGYTWVRGPWPWEYSAQEG